MALLGADNNSNSYLLHTVAPVATETSWTLCLWVYPTSLTLANGFGELAGMIESGGLAVLQWFIRSNGTLEYWRNYSGTQLRRVSNTGYVTANTWQFLCLTHGGGNATDVHFYRGTLSALASEATYASGQNSSGTVSTATNTLTIGNLGQDYEFSVPARFGLVAVYDRVLSLAEVQTQQFLPRPIGASLLFAHPGYNGTASVADWSGNGRTGTVGSALSVADHVPLPPPFGAGWVPYVVGGGASDTVVGGALGSASAGGHAASLHLAVTGALGGAAASGQAATLAVGLPGAVGSASAGGHAGSLGVTVVGALGGATAAGQASTPSSGAPAVVVDGATGQASAAGHAATVLRGWTVDGETGVATAQGGDAAVGLGHGGNQQRMQTGVGQ